MSTFLLAMSFSPIRPSAFPRCSARFERRNFTSIPLPMMKILFLACISLASLVTSRGQVVFSTFSGYTQYELPKRLGVGGPHVTLYWYPGNPSLGFGYVIGSGQGAGLNDDTDVALASGVTDISQITNASSYTFTDYYIDVNDAQSKWGIGDFVVMHNKVSDYYGVLRIDDIRPVPLNQPSAPFDGLLDATWWFDRDHGTDFSGPATMLPPVPEPSFYGVGAC